MAATSSEESPPRLDLWSWWPVVTVSTPRSAGGLRRGAGLDHALVGVAGVLGEDLSACGPISSRTALTPSNHGGAGTVLRACQGIRVLSRGFSGEPLVLEAGRSGPVAAGLGLAGSPTPGGGPCVRPTTTASNTQPVVRASALSCEEFQFGKVGRCAVGQPCDPRGGGVELFGDQDDRHRAADGRASRA